jgi:hypothetical protein
MEMKHGLVPLVAAVVLVVTACAADEEETARDDEQPDPSSTSASASASSSAPAGAGDVVELLEELTVAVEERDGYDRDLFPHWSSQGDGCDTREAVLQRDGEGVEVDADCYPTAGSWTSPYDGERWTVPSDVDIDHVVPLAEAWASGAGAWTMEEREAFANDLDRPQLLAVTDNVNQEKSDQDPAEWLPPVESYHCAYVTAWIEVKHDYQLSVDEAEKQALDEALSSC